MSRGEMMSGDHRFSWTCLVVGAVLGTTTGGLAWAVMRVISGGPIGCAISLLGAAVLNGGAVLWLGRGVVARCARRLAAAVHTEVNAARARTGWEAIDDVIETMCAERQAQACQSQEFERIRQTLREIRTPGEPERAGDPGRDAGRQLAILLDSCRQSALALVERSEAMAKLTEQIARGSTDQAETVNRTTSTVELLSDKIDRICQGAESAAVSCTQTRQEAHRGLEQLQGLVSGIERLRERVEDNGRKARRLGDRSVEIGSIVELIQGLSQRTDMLALNATIESVRAGEHGRGFAVVAEEIRKLAERAADATRQIDTLINAIQVDAHESIRSVAEEHAEMEREAKRVHKASEALERIRQASEHAAELVDGISHSATDQVVATQELVRAMQRISEVSLQIRDGAARMSDQTGDLNRVSGRLHHLVCPSPDEPTRGADSPPPRRAVRELVSMSLATKSRDVLDLSILKTWSDRLAALPADRPAGLADVQRSLEQFRRECPDARPATLDDALGRIGLVIEILGMPGAGTRLFRDRGGRVLCPRARTTCGDSDPGGARSPGSILAR